MELVDVPRDDAYTHEKVWWATNNYLLVVEVEVVGGSLVCRQRRFYEGLEGEARLSVPSPKTFNSGLSPFFP